MKQLGKYLLIVVLFLLPGVITYCNVERQHSEDCSSYQESSDYVLSEYAVSAEQICAVMMDTFSAIRQVETYKVEGSVYHRDSFKVVQGYSRLFHIISPQEVNDGNFIHLLSERYYQGFYIHFRKLVI